MQIAGRRLTVSRTSVALLVWLVPAALAACFADLSGLTGGTPPIADATADHAVDAGRSGDSRNDARGADAASDAPDAPHALDAPADAPGPLCPGYPDALLCDDFDDGPIGAGWTTTSLAAASLALSDAESSSPPLSLLAEINDGGVTGEGTAALVFNVPHALERVRDSYDIYFDQVGQRSAAIGSIYLLDGLSYYGVYLFAHGGAPQTTPSMEIYEDGELPDGGESIVPHPFMPSIPIHVWTRVILDVDFGPTPSFTLTLEAPPGTSATPVLDNAPITPTITGATMSVYGGIEYVVFPETTGWRIYVDNVVIEAP